jgi:hypothetical protein
MQKEEGRVGDGRKKRANTRREGDDEGKQLEVGQGDNQVLKGR